VSFLYGQTEPDLFEHLSAPMMACRAATIHTTHWELALRYKLVSDVNVSLLFMHKPNPTSSSICARASVPMMACRAGSIGG